MQTVTLHDIQSLLNSNEPVTLVEVLPPQYYAQWHLPGAINIPLDDFNENIASRLPDKHAMIVVYCANANCNNSNIAAQKLAQQGYTHVVKYSGGKQDWESAGLRKDVA